MDTESTRTLFNAICTFKDKPRENRNTEKNENDEIRKLRQQVKELNELVTAKKENNVLNSEYDCASFSDSLPTVQHAKLCETDTVQNLTDIKMKRILAKKKHGNSFLYLVQLVGEPSQNAQWRSISQLSRKAQDLLISRPPPLVK